MPRRELTLRARYVFPVDGPPVPGGVVRISGERIDYVGPGDRQPDLDLGNAAVVPGFVNAHTHLELSNLRAKSLGGGDFTAWLRQVVEARRGQTGADLVHAVQRGIDASLASGTTLVGDISTGGRSWQLLARSSLRATAFCELLGLGPERAGETAKAAGQFLEWAGYCTRSNSGTRPEVGPADTSGLTLGEGICLGPLPHTRLTHAGSKRLASLSPHAPYSTHPKLYDLAADWGSKTGVVICTHLAETREELRLLEHRDGPLREFLVSVGAWNESWVPAGTTPQDYLTSPIAQQANWLIAHGNYLNDLQISRMADSCVPPTPAPLSEGERGNRRRLAVAFCPRTHAYFAHSRHPYRQMLDRGLVVCLGTDSLASTSTLSILDELRFLHRRDPSLSGATLLHMATAAGAWALGRDQQCGSLTPGKLADLAVVRLPDRDAEDPHHLLLESDGPVTHTMIGGRFAFQMR